MLTITLENEIEKEGEIRIAAPHLSDSEFYDFCVRNSLLRIERDEKMNILVMMPADTYGDSRNNELSLDLGLWNRALTVPGITFGPSAGFTLPSGAVRSPDAAWISADRWNVLPVALRAPFAHIAPDFVVEIMSPSDRLPKAQDKMDEYLAAGVRLGWLVDRANRVVTVYRVGVAVETFDNPATMPGDPELAGLVINTARVFSDTI